MRVLSFRNCLTMDSIILVCVAIKRWDTSDAPELADLFSFWLYADRLE